MRGTVILVAGLLVASCGGNAATTTPPSSTITAVTESSTTVSDTSTSTTTTIPTAPWTTVPPLEIAPLAFGSGFESLASVETFCVDVQAVGVEGRSPLGTVLDTLGFEVVETECQATLNILLFGQRTSAEYIGVGTCYSGEVLTGSITLLVGDDPVGSWPADREMAPPPGISGCSGPEEPLKGWAWYGQLNRPLYEMFGNIGLAAALIHMDAYPFGIAEVSEDFFEDEQVPLFIASLLYSPDDLTASHAAYALGTLAGRDSYSPSFTLDALTSTVPYLVRYVDRDPQYGAFEARALLRKVTGASQGDLDLAAVWSWWEDNLP